MSIRSDLDDLDTATLFAPIPGNKPTGVDPRENVSPESIYYRIRDVRSEARDAERKEDRGEDRGEGGNAAAAWRSVRILAEQGLATVAKDLEFATWLTEALVRTAGIRGLATGAAIIAGLVERYWDELYPTPDEDGVATRVAPLAGLSGQGVDGTLIQPLRKSALFARRDGSQFRYWEYENSLELAGIADPERRRQRIEANVLPFEEVEAEARSAPAAHWAALRADLTAALDGWAGMAAVLDARAGSASVSTGRVRDLLTAMQAAVSRFAPAAAVAVLTEVSAVVTSQSPASSAPVSASMDRDAVLRQLDEIARWFMQHEPSSPLAYTLTEALRRARMSWPELISEVMSDQNARDSLLTSLGIKPPSDQ